MATVPMAGMAFQMGATSQPMTSSVPVGAMPTTPTSAPSANPVLKQVLSEYPGLAKNFNTDNTSVVFASGERQQRGAKERGGLEFWPSTEQGDKDYPHPSLGKNVLEVYSDDLKNNPTALKQAVYGDLMHGMTSDPYWKSLRDEYMKSFTPQETKRQAEHKTWWEDVNGSKGSVGDATYDAYIRGWLADEGGGKSSGQKESGNTMYSPKQLQLMQKMEEYLKTGKEASDGHK
jgi:hypothetical protein